MLKIFIFYIFFATAKVQRPLSGKANGPAIATAHIARTTQWGSVYVERAVCERLLRLRSIRLVQQWLLHRWDLRYGNLTRTGLINSITIILSNIYCMFKSRHIYAFCPRRQAVLNTEYLHLQNFD